MKIKGTVAIVTGAAAGIGKALTERLLENGALFVAIFDISEKIGSEAEKELRGKFGENRVQFYQCDVSSQEQLAENFSKVHKKHNRLDIVVNNAAIQDENKKEETMMVNMVAVIRGTLLAKKFMSTANGGQGGVVLNTASVNGFLCAWIPTYAACKAAVIQHTRCLPCGDPDFKPGGGMRVGAVCPGFVDTELGRCGNRLLAEGVDWPIVTPMNLVVDAYVKIIEDDTLNGIILTATPAGINTHEFPSNEELNKKYKIFPA